MPLAAGVAIGPYLIEAALDGGAMGEVYRATDLRLGRRVALKILPPHVADRADRRARFAREARALSGLSHPTICAVHDVGEWNGVPYLVMEYVEGETLAGRLARGPLPIDEAVRIAIDLAGALQYAHGHGVVHRDLKPSNVMLTGGSAKLLDFGLARIDDVFAPADRDAAGATATLTEEGAIVGTVHYMAPEQLEGLEADGRSDIFALGAVIYEMITGRRAFDADSRARAIAAVLERTPPPIAAALGPGAGDAVPPLLEEIVSRCLAKRREHRWQTASDLKVALTWLDSGVARVDRAAPAARIRPAAAAGWAFAGVLLGVGGALGVMLAGGGSAPPVETRFEIDPPPDGTFNPSSAFVAVSPDGRHVAFVASSGSTGSQLWIRSRDDLAARRLPDTADASQPFWSPDSRTIAFGAARKVKAIDVSTHQVRTLADMVFLAGTWSREGVILLAPAPNEDRLASLGLHRIPAEGGAPEAATRPDAGQSETSHGWPQFLPDGRRFVYLARSNDPAHDGTVMMGSLDSAERIPLFTSDSHAVYATGCFLFMRGGRLLAQPFDLARLRATGEPVTIADGVERNPESRRGAFTVSDTGVLVYRSVGQTGMVWVDRRGVPLGTIGRPGHYSNPTLSPDEQRLAVERADPATGRSDIWIYELRSGLASRFTHTGAERPLWSPLADRIVYRTFALQAGAPAWRRAFVSRATVGDAEERLVPDVSPFDSPVSWTPDGESLIYTNFNARASPALWMLPLAGDRSSVPLAPTLFDVVQGQLSSDGRWLAYVSNESGDYAVYVRPFPSGDGKWPISDAGGIEPFWRRDSRELFYLASDRSLMAVSVEASGGFHTSPPVRLFQAPLSTWVNPGYTRNQYVVTADGQRFLLIQPSGAAPAITAVIGWDIGLPPRR